MIQRYLDFNNRGQFMKQNLINKYLKEVRIISPKEKTKDMDGRTIRPGDYVTHYKFGKGQIESVDLKTYSIPFIVVEIMSGKFKNEKIARAANEFRKKS